MNGAGEATHQRRDRLADEVILRRTADLIVRGARGIVYGRNIIQHPNPRP